MGLKVSSHPSPRLGKALSAQAGLDELPRLGGSGGSKPFLTSSVCLSALPITPELVPKILKKVIHCPGKAGRQA